MDLSNKDMRACEALSNTEVFELAAKPVQMLSDKGTWVDYTGPLEPQLVLRRKPEEYDWLRNPEKRKLGEAPGCVRDALQDLRESLEYWNDSVGVWIERAFARNGLHTDNAYRLNPKLDPTNPDWIVWGKMNCKVQRELDESDRVEVLDHEGNWVRSDTTGFYTNGVYRIAP